MMGDSGTHTSRPEGAADINIEARLKLQSAEFSDLYQVSRSRRKHQDVCARSRLLNAHAIVATRAKS
jgi:hypothetical protein